MDRRLPTGLRPTWDEDAQIDALLACHPRAQLDPERAWATGHHAPVGAARRLGSSLLSRLVARRASRLAAGAGEPGDA